ncbi:Hpt domain-containing protein [Uliginosibacterium aquaticum]|uniref:Hpt domain-containing protein n=1 Tax=Uliginosibacterium aquaticum TaxID=2731212 RepID=A0ABX2IF58_9RHOO|nr:Hpt domain-containing protein [Uliginosibacterium aquaticum]NSL55351.1 Hpt domain-containing protein [Uliginosibacterium aquaticum]
MEIDLSRYLPQYFEESASCVQRLTESLEHLLQDGWDAATADAASRAAHCIKGNSGAFGFNEIGALAAELEYALRHAGRGYDTQNAAFIADCHAARQLLEKLLDARLRGLGIDAGAAQAAAIQLQRWQLQQGVCNDRA